MKRVSLYLPLILVAVCVLGCSETKNETQKEESKLGEFVYIDKSKCLHTDKKCMNLLDFSDDGTNHNYQVKFINTNKLRPNNFGFICSYCVSDETFKELRKKIEHNGYAYDEEDVDSIAFY